jgi:DNA (cytosine-5)-methyltransferase 1
LFRPGSRYWTFLLKLHPCLPSWTIIAQPGHWEGPFHWTNRRLRNCELASIQTFPVDYVFRGSVRSVRKQIGNAVPCVLAKSMCNFLTEVI